MSRLGRTARILTSVAVLAAAAAGLVLLSRVPQQDITGVAEVIDGDSIRLAGEEIRLKGMDAPELMQTCTVSAREYPCGREARTHLRRMLATGLVTCIGAGRDRFGRLLAHCRVRGMDVNAAMVRDGHAIDSGGYAREEAEARAAYRGLWSGTFERPRDWRQRHSGPHGRALEPKPAGG